MEAYDQGFIEKCAERGVDPEALIKHAQQRIFPAYSGLGMVERSGVGESIGADLAEGTNKEMTDAFTDHLASPDRLKPHPLVTDGKLRNMFGKDISYLQPEWMQRSGIYPKSEDYPDDYVDPSAKLSPTTRIGRTLGRAAATVQKEYDRGFRGRKGPRVLTSAGKKNYYDQLQVPSSFSDEDEAKLKEHMRGK